MKSLSAAWSNPGACNAARAIARPDRIGKLIDELEDEQQREREK